MATIPFEPRGVSGDELEVGLVLFLAPDALQADGAQASHGPRGPVIGARPFVCVSLSGNFGLWLPLFSRQRAKRMALSHRGRTGSTWWTGQDSYYEVRQVWRAERCTIARAAAAAHDPSNRHRRNRLRPDCLPMPWQRATGGA